MKFLSAPWRWDFISQVKKEKKCVFCEAVKLPDDQSLICYRGKKNFIILNKYPYNSGHLMIVPYRHLDSAAKIETEESIELWNLMNKAIDGLKKCFHPAGFNVGMNLGKIAGAGIENHIHLHIVPRWPGDANFMPVIGKTKVASYDIRSIFNRLHKEFTL